VPPTVLQHLAGAHPERFPLLLDSAAEGPLSAASLLLAYLTSAPVSFWVPALLFVIYLLALLPRVRRART